jgi:hypothetical protein
MSRNVQRHLDVTLRDIRTEMTQLEQELRDLFNLPIVNDTIIDAYNRKLARYNELKKKKSAYLDFE